MGITKTRLSEASIRNIVANVTPGKHAADIREHTEGMLNAAYSVIFDDGSGIILKIAPENKSGLMSNEINLMDAEVKAMEIMRKNGCVKVADVLCYDKSKNFCSSDYFVMEKLSGENYMFIKDSMPVKDAARINYEIGVIQNKMTGIRGEKYGLLGDSRRYDSLYDFFSMLIRNVLDDAERQRIDIGISYECVSEKLREDKAVFEEAEAPSLVHWDMWDGNIFVEDKHVSGVIDWERAMWGEPYMDDRFRRHTINDDFLRGFGKTDFTESEKRRLCWYDVLLYITMIAEVTYRKYSDDGQVQWVMPLLKDAWARLNSDM